MIIVKERKQSCIKQSLLIAIDLCKANYQTWLITYLEVTIWNANHVWKEKKTNQNAILLGLKKIDWITDAKNVEENAPS